MAVGENMLLGKDIVLRLSRIHSASVARHGGRDVLLYWAGATGTVEYLGLGRPRALIFDGELDSDLATCEVRDVRPFGYPLAAGIDVAGEAGAVEVSDEDFADIVQRGGRIDVGASEDAQAFLDGGLDRLTAISRQVMERWDYRCAITGERHPGATGMHDELGIVAIRPLALGGPLHVRNCLPMVKAAADAWLRGTISATQNLEIIVVERHVDVDLLERMRPSRTLLVPGDADLGPDPAHLAYHRQHIFGVSRD